MKRSVKIGMLCLTLLLTFSTTAFAATEVEPNNGMYYANPLTNYLPDQSVESMIGYISPQFDVDYFIFSTHQNITMQRIIFIPPDNGTYQVTVFEAFNTTGRVASGSATNGQVLVLDFPINQLSHYHIEIYSPVGSYNNNNPYYLVAAQR